jgi:hypothetical protein
VNTLQEGLIQFSVIQLTSTSIIAGDFNQMKLNMHIVDTFYLKKVVPAPQAIGTFWTKL